VAQPHVRRSLTDLARTPIAFVDKRPPSTPMIGHRMRLLRLVHSTPLSPPATTTETRLPEAAQDCPIDPAVQALLERVRIIAPLPRLVRARALARARAALASD
jgi:hypothetical protein